MRRIFNTWLAVLIALAGGIPELPRRVFGIASKSHPGPVMIEGRWHVPTRYGLMAVPAGGAPTTIDELAKGVAEVGEFVREKYDPLSQNVEILAEEQKRLAEEIKGILELQREANRAALLKEGNARRVLYRSVSGEADHWVDKLDLEILHKFATAAKNNAVDKGDSSRQKMAQAWLDNVGTYTRAMDSTTAGTGDELVPQPAERAQLWMDVNLRTAVASLFERITMPTNGFDIPLQLGDVNWYPGTANTAATSTDPATAKQTLTAQELVAVVPWAYELDEDSVVAMLPTVRASLVRNAAEVIDDVLLNADTTTTNNINADGATISTSSAGKAQYLLGWDGLIHIPLVDNTAQAVNHNAAVSDDMFNENRAQLGKYGVMPSEIAWITDINTYIRAQSVSNFRTIDKLGPNATLLTGQLGDVEGAPVIVSEQLALADTDGKVTSGGNGTNTGRLLCLNRTQYMVGFKRELLIEVERDVQKRQTLMVASFRIAFEGRNTNASDTAIGLTYDITGVST